jgi:hypothetical protein
MVDTQGMRKPWLARNWPWLILPGLAGASLSCALCIAAGALGIFSILKSHPVYRQALEAVQSDSRAQELLGAPIQAGLFLSGEISESSRSGTARISFPVSGPKGSGTITVTAHKEGGEWIINRLVLVMDKTRQKLVIAGTE